MIEPQEEKPFRVLIVNSDEQISEFYVTLLQHDRAYVGRVLAMLTTHGRNQLLRYTGRQTGPLAIALVVGQRDLVDNATRELLMVTGTDVRSVPSGS